jgi:hypothetical protein
VHFLGRWRSPFAPKLTRSAHFRRTDGSTVAVPFMHVEDAIPVREAAFDAEGVPGVEAWRDAWTGKLFAEMQATYGVKTA